MTRLTDDERLDRKMLEAQLNSRVMYRARKHGVKVLRLQRAMAGGSWRTPATKGFPDLTFFGRRVMYRELKRELGKLDEEQREWGILLKSAGCDYAVWRPSDLRSGLIEAEIQGVAFSLTPARATGYVVHQQANRGAAQGAQ